MKSEYTLPLFYQYATSVIPQSADKVISGIQKLAVSIKNGLNVIAAPQSMGKSTLALTIAISLVEQGKRVLYCTTQHQARRNFARYLCNKAGIKMPLNPSEEDNSGFDDRSHPGKTPRVFGLDLRTMNFQHR